MKLSELRAMSIEELLEFHEAIVRTLAERQTKLREQLSSLDALGPERRRGKGRSSPAKGRPVPPKYRGPSGETWAGRGMKPRWLTTLLAQGHSIEEFEIGRKRTRSNAA
ncbi:MAG TPA: H-NS histone family protein [Xanthobacteraceae bacterium]|nr:H-NS histone family protein [Xanthobacteraceae bacterium]